MIFVLTDGTTVHAGRALVRGTWNAALHEPLAASFKLRFSLARRVISGTQAFVKP